MSKLVILLVIAVTAVCISAVPVPEPGFPDFFMFADPFPDFFNNIPSLPAAPEAPVAPEPVASADEIKNLKPDKNSHVSGSFQSSSSSFKSVNGVPVEDKHSGREIINDDGQVVEDLKY